MKSKHTRLSGFMAMAFLMLAVGLLLAGTTPQPVHANDNEGFIYGKVTTRSGNVYQGIIRWDDEEAFWDDLFHSYKESRPFEDYLEEHGERGDREIKELDSELEDISRESERANIEMDKLDIRMDHLEVERENTADLDEIKELVNQQTRLAEDMKKLARKMAQLAMEEAKLERMRNNTWFSGNDNVISLLGGAININWNKAFSGGSRIFIARFGDIKTLEVIGSEDAELTMRTGTKYVVSGYSNDVGTKIRVHDDDFGEVELAWKKVDTVEFMPVPRDVTPDAYRLHGTVEADGGEYVGYIQWDSEECLSTDKLDGDSEDGRMSIPMGKIRKIERRSRGSAWVEMKDGRRLQLEGTNDVDQSIRGIMVEDPRYGRMKIPWDAFDGVVFDDKSGSGKGYDDYSPKKLEATVTDSDGESYSGLMVFDMDESESWEMLNGDMFDIEFDVPFCNIKSITPRSRNASQIEMLNGETIRLEGGQDVSDANDGVLIFVNGENKEPVYLEWDRIEKIEMKR
ncbi:MAG TPA: hypothetical protein ENH10_09250 [Bacteroidetes bacterium]|nr:hypothetical protein [Bacteroidota bacterium]HEX05321.1 hypothetical protein [Bacteroidota bacterium]